MMKSVRIRFKKVFCNIRAGIIAAGIAAAFCMPQIAGAAWEIDNTRIEGWYYGMASAAEKELRAKQQEAAVTWEKTLLSKLMFSEEKNIYDILKKLSHQEK